MGGIYSFGRIVPGWHLFIWNYCTCVDLFIWTIVHGWHLFNCDLLYMGGIYSN